MTNVKKNRAYILQSVVSKNGSWNNDFNGTPKRYGDQFFASDRALKFAVRNVMEQMNEEVFIKQWLKDNESDGKAKKNDKKGLVVLKDTELVAKIKAEKGKTFAEAFWDFADIKQFGVLYEGIAVHGVAQISHGIDLYKEGILYDDDLTGRMVFGDSRGMSTREFLSEAHFFYETSVNPKNVDYLNQTKGFEHCVYTEEDYQLLLECLEHGPRNIKSTQKMNVNTAFMLEIELKDGEDAIFGNLMGKVQLKKENGKVVYDVAGLFSYLKNKQKHLGRDLIKKVKLTYEVAEVLIEGLDTKTFEVEVVKY